MIPALRWLQAEGRWKWAALAGAALLAVFLLWFFVFRSSGAGPAPASHQPPPFALGKTITYESYRAAVDSALSDVRAARTADQKDRPSKLAHAASTLEQVDGANVSGGSGAQSAVQVDNSAIIAELKGSGANLEALEASLSALSDSLHRGSIGQQGTLTGEQASAALRQVLSDPMFQYERELTPLQKLARWLSGLTGQADPGDTLWRWLIAFIAGVMGGILTYLATDRLKNRLARLGLAVLAGLVVAIIFLVSASALGTTIEVLGAVGLVVAFVAVLVLASGAYRASAPSGKPKGISELAAVLGMGSGEARTRAEEAAAVGDYRLAIRFRTLAVLLALDESGQLVFDRSATDREYLFRAPGTLQDDLQPLLDRFGAIWYGEMAATAQDWQGVVEHAAHLEARAAAEAQARARSHSATVAGRSAA